MYRILKLISKRIGYYRHFNKEILGNNKILLDTVPSYEFYGSLFKEKQLIRIEDAKAKMYFNSKKYLESLEVINKVERLVELRGGYGLI